MRRLVLHLAAGAAALFLGAGANAGALTAANLNFNLGGEGGPSLDFPASGLTGTAISANEVTLEAGSAFAGTVTTPLVDADPATFLSVFMNDNTAGGWTGDPLTGTSVQINGVSVILGFGGVPLITVPFAAGSVGTTVINEGGVGVSVFAQGWTSGTLVIPTGPAPGAATLATAMGSVVPGTPGSVTLVAGARIATTLADDTFNILTLSMDFVSVPEPTMALLFGAGATVLGAFAWRKRRA